MADDGQDAGADAQHGRDRDRQGNRDHGRVAWPGGEGRSGQCGRQRPNDQRREEIEKEEKDKNYRVFERSYRSFSRMLDLPAGINSDAIKASLSNGVLKVTVPKPAAAQVKKVEVKAAA